jgi:hypothetical protein
VWRADAAVVMRMKAVAGQRQIGLGGKIEFAAALPQALQVMMESV